MKKIILTLLLALSFSSQAGMITTNLDSTDASLFDKVLVEINATNFAEVDTFEFSFKFDTSIFELDMNSITSELSLVNIAADLFDGLEIVKEDFGLYFLFSDFTGFTPSSGNFNIAKFSLTAKESGSSNFAVTDAYGYNNTNDNVAPTYSNSFSNGQSVVVSAASVSEPSGIAFLLMSTIGLLLVNRKK